MGRINSKQNKEKEIALYKTIQTIFLTKKKPLLKQKQDYESIPYTNVEEVADK